MTQFRVIEGNRDELEKRLVKLIWEPWNNHGDEIRALLEKLEPAGKLRLLKSGDEPKKGST